MVEGASRGRFFFARKTGEEPAMGERVQIQWDKFEERWYKHPDPEIDIAAMPIVPTMKKLEELGQDIFFRHITDKMALRTEWLEDLDALEEIMFVGYPSGIYDEVNLLPIIRKGVTATPLHVDYNGKPIFLIDASVFPGSSGSPVFIYNPSGFGTNKSFTVGSRFIFLGVIAEVLIRQETGTLEFVSIPIKIEPRIRTKETLDLGIVYKANTVIETVQRAYSKLQRNL